MTGIWSFFKMKPPHCFFLMKCLKGNEYPSNDETVTMWFEKSVIMGIIQLIPNHFHSKIF